MACGHASRIAAHAISAETITPPATLNDMSSSRIRLPLVAAAVAGVLALAACSTSPGSSPVPTSSVAGSVGAGTAAPPEGRVIGTGTVLDVGGEVTLCLGAVAESYPPQCAGIPVDGWSWDGVEGSESSGETTWGSYAAYGTFDGDRFTVTDPPIMLALFDPVRGDDPVDGVQGTSTEAELQRVQDEMSSTLGDAALSLWTERGYVWVQVIWDDGTLQDEVDDAYGDGVVVVTSALREID